MISRMFNVSLILCYLLTISLSCRLLVPSELLNGCVFDPMIISVSHAGFSINRDNCNSAIAKHVFAEQPLVYYGRARSVSVANSRSKSEKLIRKWHRNEKKNSIFKFTNNRLFEYFMVFSNRLRGFSSLQLTVSRILSICGKIIAVSEKIRSCDCNDWPWLSW